MLILMVGFAGPAWSLSSLQLGDSVQVRKEERSNRKNTLKEEHTAQGSERAICEGDQVSQETRMDGTQEQLGDK